MLLLGAAYFAVFGGEYDLFDLRRVRAQQEAEQQRAEEERTEVEALRARRDSLANDPGTIERIARERYGLVRDGEKSYRIEVEDSAADSASARPAREGRRDTPPDSSTTD